LRSSTARRGSEYSSHPLPAPRGPVSEHLLFSLRLPPHQFTGPPIDTDDVVLLDEDLQLALYCRKELHYQGLPGVSDHWEWEPSLLDFGRQLEIAFERRLRSALPDHKDIDAADVPNALCDLSRAGRMILAVWLAAPSRNVLSRPRNCHPSLRLQVEGGRSPYVGYSTLRGERRPPLS
jgi:hypothetical protein